MPTSEISTGLCESPPYTFLELNRTEAVKSVLIGLLLQVDGVVGKLVASQLKARGCTMRSEKGVSLPLKVERVNDDVQIATLFHTWRDLKKAGVCVSELTKKNEIDVVVVWKNRMVLGLELKWGSSAAKLSQQLIEERECLKALARYYNPECQYTSLVAIVPEQIPQNEISEADGQITIQELAGFARAISDERPNQPLLGVISSEIQRMVSEPMDRKTFGFDEILHWTIGVDGEHTFVGYYDGRSELLKKELGELKIRRWKVVTRSNRKPLNKGWLHLADVKEIFRQKIDCSNLDAS